MTPTAQDKNRRNESGLAAQRLAAKSQPVRADARDEQPSFVAEAFLVDALSDAVGEKAAQQMLRNGALRWSNGSARSAFGDAQTPRSAFAISLTRAELTRAEEVDLDGDGAQEWTLELSAAGAEGATRRRQRRFARLSCNHHAVTTTLRRGR